MTEIDRSLIGTELPPFFVEVERGAIRKFAAAIGDDDPRFRDVDVARRFGHADLLAPPTFPTVFRPPQDPPWIAGLDRRRIVAGEVGYRYARPIVAGLRLACSLKFLGVDEKTGSKGSMALLRQALACRDEAGDLVVTCLRTTVYRSREQVEGRSLA